jgi:hypothetical protein
MAPAHIVAEEPINGVTTNTCTTTTVVADIQISNGCCCQNNDEAITTITLIDIIVSDNDPTVRHRSLTEYCRGKSLTHLLQQCAELDEFRRCNTNNLYHTVRALFFLYALHRYHLVAAAAAAAMDDRDTSISITTAPPPPSFPATGPIPYRGYQCLLGRRFDAAVDIFLPEFQRHATVAIGSALATAYYQLAFQTLANQVHRSVEHHPGNQWMFDKLEVPTTTTTTANQHQHQHPLRIRSELLNLSSTQQHYPILMEETPVRMDLSHCGWSDIFFLGMDFPEGARVLNASINLQVRRSSNNNSNSDEQSTQPQPPIASYLQVIPEPGVLRLTSIDLQCSVTLTHLSQVFDFGKDHLGLLRAGIIASGMVPPGWQQALCDKNNDAVDVPLAGLLDSLIGRPNLGLQLVTNVRNIPKGSRLAVSTNLLASIIAVGMRATGQTEQLIGTLQEEERRLVAARAILGRRLARQWGRLAWDETD